MKCTINITYITIHIESIFLLHLPFFTLKGTNQKKRNGSNVSRLNSQVTSLATPCCFLLHPNHTTLLPTRLQLPKTKTSHQSKVSSHLPLHTLFLSSPAAPDPIVSKPRRLNLELISDTTILPPFLFQSSSPKCIFLLGRRIPFFDCHARYSCLSLYAQLRQNPPNRSPC